MIEKQYINHFEIVREKIADSNSYPFNIPALKNITKVELHPNVTFIIGENGTGKSTLLEALAVQYGFNAEGGSKNFSFSTQRTESPLSECIRIGKGIIAPKDGFFLRAESFYNAASYLDLLQKEDPQKRALKAYGNKSLHEQSHGESFFALFTNRFGGHGVYLLDEPEAALSAQRQLAFLVRLHELVNMKSQFVIATHSPLLLSYPHSKIIELSDSGYKTTSFSDTEPFIVHKAFLNDPARMLKELGID